MARTFKPSRGSDIEGYEDLVRTLEEIGKGVSGEKRNQYCRDVMQVLGTTATVNIADVAKAKAKAKGVPQSVIDSIFTDQRVSKIRNNEPAVLVGVNKKRTMVEWTADESPASPRAKVSPGGKVSMSLATMFEFGTSTMKAKPYMRPALRYGRSVIINDLMPRLRAVMEKWAR